MKKIAFMVPPSVEILDLAGPVQVFTEARYYGFEAELEFYCLEEASVSSSGLPFGKVSHFSEANLSDRDYLFVPGMDFQYKSNNVYTSAGISAGIDLSLAILEELKGALFTHKVARGLVVYHRRSQNHTQQSVYLDYRNHINPNIHIVQDHLIEHLADENSVESLAKMVAMSPRNPSRVFKEKTSTTILEYLTPVGQFPNRFYEDLKALYELKIIAIKQL